MTQTSHCQSCGMPMKRDPKGGGSYADGSRCDRYCSHCFQNGAFAQPDLTVEQMQSRVAAKLREFGIPGFLTGWFTRAIPRLERWNSATR